MTTFVSIDQDILAVGFDNPAYVYSADDVEVTVQAGVTVKSADGDSIITGRAKSALINNGQVLSDMWSGVGLYGEGTAVVTNNADGLIKGGVAGIWVNAFPNGVAATILNHGEVRGETGSGVQFGFFSGGNLLANHGLIFGGVNGVSASARTGDTTIENFGVLRGGTYGVLVNSGSADVVNTINNHTGGKIKGTEAGIGVPSGGQIVVKNKGKIIGGIDCDADGRGDKVVNKKKIKGETELGPGEDKFVFAGGKQGKVFGEADADKFVFKGKLAPEKHVAKIGDFAPGEDMILLSKGLFKGIGEKGPLKGKYFHAGKKAADEDDRIVYDRDSGKVWFDKDGQGGAEAKLFAKLKGDTKLKADDFIVVG